MNKGLPLLGLAKKAGKLAVGNEAVSSALAQGRAYLIVFAADAAPNTIRRFTNRGDGRRHIKLTENREELGAVLGYQSCAVAAVCDSGLGKAFISAYDSSAQSIKAVDKQHKNDKENTEVPRN